MRELICLAFGVAAGYLAISMGAGILVVGLVSFIVTYVLMDATS